MARITKSQLEGALGRYLNAWAGMGFNLELRFQEGTSTMGVAYRLQMKDGSNAPGTTGGYLGMTRSEAWDTLLTISRTLEDLSHLRTIQAEQE
jgi:hypothetical protein